MNDAKWFGRRSVATLAQRQSQSVEGVSATVRTMLAAYTQYDDIAFLLQFAGNMESEDRDRVAKIQARHTKYAGWVHDEVIPETTT